MAKNKISKAIKRLNVLYDKIPATKGCLEHINKPREEGGCGGWCCSIQSPQVLQVEFLNTWHHIIREWDFNQIIDLIERALKTYFDPTPTKGCVFWDKESKLCQQHTTRPLACRQYGITPKEEFEARFVRLKILYQDQPDAVIRPQCRLVSTKNGKKVTRNDTDNWWEDLKKAERSIGIPEKRITDEPGGTYRTYHDYLLMYLFKEQMIDNLQILKLYGERVEQELAINIYMTMVRKNIKKLIKDEKAVVDVS